MYAPGTVMDFVFKTLFLVFTCSLNTVNTLTINYLSEDLKLELIQVVSTLKLSQYYQFGLKIWCFEIKINI